MIFERRLFRILLMAFPADVRHRHGTEMWETFQSMSNSRRSRGRGAQLRFLLQTVADMLLEGFRERSRRVRSTEQSRLREVGLRNLMSVGGGDMWLTDLLDDLSMVFRGLARTPLAGFVLVLTLALGIGANTAVFSVLQGVLLRPLPYPEPEEVLTLRHAFTAVPSVGLQGIPGPDLLDYQAGAPSLEALGSVFTLETNLNDDQGAARVTIGWITPGFFDVFDPATAIGRRLEPSDWTPRARAQMEDPTFQPPPMPVMLSYEMWESRFGSDRDLVGRSVTINGTRMNVVGVLEEGFRVLGPSDGSVPPRIDAFSYLPIPMTEGGRGEGGGVAFARLADGATLVQARAELSAVATSLAATWDTHARLGTEVVVEPLLDGVVGEARPTLWVLFGSVGLVLLVAIMNVANLQLVRAGAKQQDFAVRVALGVGRGRIVRLLLTESFVLAGLGALGGLFLATGGLHALVALAPPDLPRMDSVSLDGGVLSFTLVTSVAAAFLFGMAPAIALSKVQGNSLLSSRGTVGGGSTRLRNAVIVGELAFSLVLLAGAGLLVRSFSELRAVDPGYDPEGAVAVELALPFFAYRPLERRQAFFNELLERAGEVPGVTAAGLSPKLPFTGPGGSWSAPYGLPGSDLSSETAPRARYRAASPGFFDAMGARMVAGRAFRRGDAETGSEPVVVLERRIAEATWPDQDAVGHYLDVSIVAYIGQGRQTTARVVGVVEPMRFESLMEAGDPLIWLPFNEYGSLEAALVLRGPGDPAVAAAGVRSIINEIDPSAPVYAIRRLSDDIRDATARLRFATLLVGVFALGALILAAVGLYGVISTTVQRRTREIGVRLALGAPADSICTMVLTQGARLAVLGVTLGGALSLLTGPLLRTLLFGVEPTDIPTLVGTATLLVAVAGVAAWIPATRASRLNPVQALRYE